MRPPESPVERRRGRSLAGPAQARRTGVGRLARLIVLVLGLLLLGAAAARPVYAQDEPPGRPTRLEGYLKLMGAGFWWVGDTQVVVTAETVVIEKRGRAEVGAWVVIQGHQAADGPLFAEFVMVERPAGPQGILWPFAGMLTKQAGELWVVSETLIRVTPDTAIRGAPRPGWLVWVVAEQPPDALELQAVVVEAIASDPSQVPVEFEGVLEATGPEWRVSGQAFRLSPAAVVIGAPTIGQQAEVQAIVQPDGSLIAHLLRMVDTSADARISALVTGIAGAADDAQVWDLLVFPPNPWAEPLIGTVQVDANTLVDESRAVARVGQWVEIQGITIGPDQYQADVIRLEQPVPVAIAGELRPAGAAAWWVVDGAPVWLNNARLARLAGQPGSDVIVRGVRLGNGVVWAERITPIAGALR